MEKLLVRLKGYYLVNLFTVFLRLLIGGAFIYASLPKIFGDRFTQIEKSNPIGAFFECIYALPEYWCFLGWSQAIAGLLLITQRFALVGSFAFFGIILNIFFITISLDMRGTPTVVFLMLMATVWLIFWDFEKWKNILFSSPHFIPVKVDTIEDNSGQMWIFASLGLLLLVFGLLFLVILKMPGLWLVISISVVFLAIGVSYKLHKNGRRLRI